MRTIICQGHTYSFRCLRTRSAFCWTDFYVSHTWLFTAYFGGEDGKAHTFAGPSLIFFIWSRYLVSSASSLRILTSMASVRTSVCQSARWKFSKVDIIAICFGCSETYRCYCVCKRCFWDFFRCTKYSVHWAKRIAMNPWTSKE